MTGRAIPFHRHAGLDPASIAPPETWVQAERWTPDQVRGDEHWFAVGTQKLLAISLDRSVV
jgi:hypothetical protein